MDEGFDQGSTDTGGVADSSDNSMDTYSSLSESVDTDGCSSDDLGDICSDTSDMDLGLLEDTSNDESLFFDGDINDAYTIDSLDESGLEHAMAENEIYDLRNEAEELNSTPFEDEVVEIPDVSNNVGTDPWEVLSENTTLYNEGLEASTGDESADSRRAYDEVLESGNETGEPLTIDDIKEDSSTMLPRDPDVLQELGSLDDEDNLEAMRDNDRVNDLETGQEIAELRNEANALDIQPIDVDETVTQVDQIHSDLHGGVEDDNSDTFVEAVVDTPTEEDQPDQSEGAQEADSYFEEIETGEPENDVSDEQNAIMTEESDVVLHDPDQNASDIIQEDEIEPIDPSQETIDYNAVFDGIDEYDFNGKDYIHDAEQLSGLLDGFTEDNWGNLDLDGQKEQISGLFDYVANTLDLDEPPKIEYYQGRDGEYGGYNDEDNILMINENMLYRSDEAADTIAHELWHAYQHERAINPESPKDYLYQVGFENYISAEDDFDAYQRQLIEAEARAFADQFKGEIARSSGRI